MLLRRSLIAAAVVALPLGLAATPGAAQGWVVDASHTHVTFEVNHLGYSTTKGQFRKVEGTLELDANRVEAAKVRFTIDTRSVDTNWEARDAHLRRADFFDVEKFPTLTFTSTRVAKTGDKTADITGDLTILGQTRPVTFRTTLNQASKHPFNGKDTMGFSAQTTIKRSDWGMKWGVPAIGDEVRIDVQLEVIAN
jgi:polyisoprenoid-binding protein YceI